MMEKNHILNVTTEIYQEKNEKDRASMSAGNYPEPGLLRAPAPSLA